MQDLTDRVRNIRDALTAGLVERGVAIRLALLSALSGEHLLLVGPPGTAKSLVARRLRLAFTDAAYFERLLTRFSVPEELFGPLSIKGLEEDRYERLTASYLPTASIAFLDEIFKANSAILNALLTLLNEREFDNGTRRERTPLMAVVGASNELPEGEELDALFDRFLLRLHVGPVSKDEFPGLLKLRGDAAPNVPDALKLTRADLDAVRKTAGDVRVPDGVVESAVPPAGMVRCRRDTCVGPPLAQGREASTNVGADQRTGHRVELGLLASAALPVERRRGQGEDLRLVCRSGRSGGRGTNTTRYHRQRMGETT